MQAVAVAQQAPLSEQLSAALNDLHQFVSSIQRPKLGDESWSQRMQDMGSDLALRMEGLRETMEDTQQYMHEAVEEITKNLQAYTEELAASPNVKKTQELYEELAYHYEEMILHLRSMKASDVLKSLRSRHLKPIKFGRTTFHMSMGIISVTLYEFFISRVEAMIILGILGSMFITLDITRRIFPSVQALFFDKLLAGIARPFERHKVPGATYYLVALFVLVLFFSKPIVCGAALVLAFADPVASLAGKAWGTKKLYGEKSWAGSIAFFVVAFCVLMMFWGMSLTTIGTMHLIGASLFVAFAGTVGELFSTKLDDNFTIPVACALAALLVL